MKKNTSLLAATAAVLCGASLGAQAQAPSGVTIYGALDINAGRFTGSASGVNAQDRSIYRVESGGMSTSNLGFRGSEDLGGGLVASFDLSTFMRNDTGAIGRSDAIGAPVNVAADPFWSRFAWVGLSSRDLGRLRAGNITTLLFVNSITGNAFGDSTVFGPLNLVTHIGGPQAGGTSWTNQLVYDSPTWDGLRFSLARSLSEGQGGHNDSARIAYESGPLSASAVWQSVKKNPSTFADGLTTNNVKTWMIGGAYDFKVVKVYAHLGQIQNDGTETTPLDVGYRVVEVSASVPLGNGSLLAGYAQRKTSDVPAPVPATAVGGNLKRDVLTLGYDYNFSKRTDLYAMLMSDKTQTRTLGSAAPTAVDASGVTYGIGVRQRF